MNLAIMALVLSLILVQGKIFKKKKRKEWLQGPCYHPCGLHHLYLVYVPSLFLIFLPLNHFTVIHVQHVLLSTV